MSKPGIGYYVFNVLPFLVFVALLVFTVMFLVEWVLAEEVVSPQTVLGIAPLPCGGGMVYYDTDGDPSNGPEVITVYSPDEDTPRLTVYYKPGDNGKFDHAVARIPNKPEVRFDTLESLDAVYSGPCDVVLEEKGLGA